MREIELLEILDAAVAKCIDEKNVAIAFSGGLDSAVIAFLAKKHANVKGYTVGVAGSRDIVWGVHAANLLAINHQKIELSEKEVLGIAEELRRKTEISSILILSYELPVYALLKFASEKIILTGAGADELFGGYSRYLRILRADPQELKEELKKDLEKARIEREIEQKVASELGKQICSPYMDEEVVKFAFSLSHEKKIYLGRRKVILRDCARIAGIPPEIYEREKKAAQYSSGVYKVLRKNL
ncbi:MAG: asparagine synthase C-terminal domain-containing protein [Thermoplasmata archaeon]